MLNYYQPLLWPFLHAHSTNPNCGRIYYHSFEDGLWDLLAVEHVPKNSVVLIPNFYCMDVVENIRLHGFQVAYYELDRHFQIKTAKLLHVIQRFQPAVLILFHACGITNQQTHTPSLIKTLSKKMLVIEDYVHRLLDPSQITLHSGNHFYMDSLRKVSPLPGSFLYGSKHTLSLFNSTSAHADTVYQWSSFFWFFLFRCTLVTGYLLRNNHLVLYAHSTLLKKHDDLIGDSMLTTRGVKLFSWIHQWINFRKVEQVKTSQVVYYKKLLSNFGESSPFYSVNIPLADYGKLHVYPIGVKNVYIDRLTDYLHRRFLPIWCKFLDCPWSQKQGVLFLPVGFHVSKREQEQVASILEQFTNELDNPDLLSPS